MKKVSLEKLRINDMTFKLPMRHLDEYSETSSILVDKKNVSIKYTSFSVDINVNEFINSSDRKNEKTKIFVCPVCHKSFSVDIKKATALLLRKTDFKDMDKELRKKILSRLYYRAYVFFVALLFFLVFGGFCFFLFSPYVIPKGHNLRFLIDMDYDQMRFLMFFFPVLVSAFLTLLYYLKLRFLTLPCNLLFFIDEHDPFLANYKKSKNILTLARYLTIREENERHFIQEDPGVLFDSKAADLTMRQIYDLRDVKKLDVKET